MSDARGSRLRLGSSFRSRPAAETLAIGQGLMAALGISRLTDITRMDRLGLPVFSSTRPRGKALCVHAGKGLRPQEAQVGALMEAVEYAAADPANSRWTARTMTIAELVAQFAPGLHLVDFVPTLGLELTPEQSITTVECEELRDGSPIFLPAEIVFVPYALGVQRIFGWGSNGLASGNSLAEATLHGLFEVLERDALAMNTPRDGSYWVAQEGLPEPWRGLAATWHGLGIELAVRQVPSALGLACFEAFVFEPGSSNVDVARGAGLHFDAEIALARAVCEAAQSRLSHIHGGRDDITGFYAQRSRRAADQHDSATLARIFDRSRTVDFAALPHDACQGLGIDDVLARLLGRMAEAGFQFAFRHRFAIDLGGLHVVKVVVAKTEQQEHDRRRIGPRLLARIIDHA